MPKPFQWLEHCPEEIEDNHDRIVPYRFVAFLVLQTELLRRLLGLADHRGPGHPIPESEPGVDPSKHPGALEDSTRASSMLAGAPHSKPEAAIGEEPCHAHCLACIAGLSPQR